MRHQMQGPCARFVTAGRTRRVGVASRMWLSDVVCALLAICVLGSARAERRHIQLDGCFDDWQGLVPVWVDPSGDGGASGIDIGSIWATDDDDHLFLGFDVGAEIILQSAQQLTLYIDGDNNPATGFQISGIGAELRWTYGQREGMFFQGEDWTTIEWAAIGLVTGPTFSGHLFETAIARDALPDGAHALFTGTTFRFLLHDLQGSGDWAPNAGSTIAYAFDQGALAPLPTLGLEQSATGAPRLLTYNVEFDGLFEYGKQPAFGRILQAVDPDVIAFQEIYDHDATETRLVVEQFLGTGWMARQVSDKVVLTRSGILNYWSIAGGRAGAFLISPVGSYTSDLLLIDAHLSCCDNDPARQEQVDAIMAFVRDAQTPGGNLDLGPDNPIVITGDMNFVGLARQLQTLLTGDIDDEATYGPDFAPDWDGSDLYDSIMRQPANSMSYTWFDAGNTYSPGRLDFVIYTDSNARTEKGVMLQTALLTPEYLALYGLQANDTDVATDHLPCLTDLAPREEGAVAWFPDAPLGLSLSVAGPNPGWRGTLLQLNVAEGALSANEPLTLSVVDATGRLMRELPCGTLSPGEHRVVWDGRDRCGRPVSAGPYWIRATTSRGTSRVRAFLMH